MPLLYQRGEHGSRSRRPRKSPLEEMQSREETDRALLEASGGVPEPQPSILERATDLALRPTYAIAGFTEEASTTGDIRAALARAKDEFFSTEKAQKERFGKVLEDLDVPEMGNISTLMPWLYNETGEGWKFKRDSTMDISGRGTIGFLMDTPFDPFTYLGFGLNKAAHVVMKGGKLVDRIALTRPGQAKAKELLATETPKAAAFVQSVLSPIRRKYIGRIAVPEDMPTGFVRNKLERVLEGKVSAARSSHEMISRRLAADPLNPALMAEEALAKGQLDDAVTKLNTLSRRIEARERAMPRVKDLGPYTDEEALLRAREIDFHASNVAEQAAISHISELAKAGNSRWIDTSAVRFAGRPLLDKELFKPIGMAATRLARHIEEMPLGTQILSGTRSVGKGLDRLFNETSRAASKHPGVSEAKSLFHAETRLNRKHLEDALNTIIPGKILKAGLETPAQWAGGEVKSVGEYLALHLDDPVRFPLDKLPPTITDQLPDLRRLTAEMFEEEARRDLIDPRAFRENYLPHFFENTDEELEQLSSIWRSRRGAGFNEVFSNGPFREQRTFPTLTDAMEFAKKLKAEGIINFDLKPNLDVRDALFKRGMGHSHAIAAETFKIRAYQAMGIDPWKIGEETFAHVFPDLSQSLKIYVTAEAEALPAQLRNKFAKLPRTAMLRQRLGIEPPREDPQLDFMKELFPSRRAAAMTKAERAIEREGKRMARLNSKIEVLKKSSDPKAPEMIAVAERTIVRAQNKQKKLRDALSRAENIPERPSPDAAVDVGRLLARAFAGKPVSTSGLTPELKALYWLGRLTAVKDLRQLQGMMKRHYDEITNLDPDILTKVREAIGISRRKVLAQYSEPYKLVKLPSRYIDKKKRAIYLPPSVANEVDKLSEGVINKKEVKGILAAYDFIQDWFKMSVTSFFPAFHVRNAYSNVAQNFAALGLRAFNPVTMFRTAAIMNGAEGTLKTPLRDYTFEEIRTLFRMHGLETPGAQLTERVGRSNVILDNPISRATHSVGGRIENSAKLMNFVGHLEEGYSPAQAGLRVQKFLFDYDALSPWERDVMRRLIPFYTWTSKNLRLYANLIKTNPGRVAAMLKMNDNERGPSRDMLPHYLQGDFKVRLKTDKGVTYATGLDLPASQALETAFGGGGRNAFARHISSFNPAIKVFLELGFGQEAFTGRDIEERQQLGDFMGGVIEKLPESTQRWLEFTKEDRDGEMWYAMNGTKAYLLFKSYVLSRIFSTARHLEDDNFKQWAIDNLTGVELKEFDLTQAQEKILRNKLKEWEKELISRGVLAPGRPFLPKASPYREKK